MLAILAVQAFRHYTHPHEISVTKHLLKKKRLSFVTGFLVAASNPLMIIGWLAGAQVADQWGALPPSDFKSLTIFIFFGAFGLGSYLTLLTLILHKVRRFLSEKNMRIISLAFSLLLFAMAIYFFVQAIMVFTGNGSDLDIQPQLSLEAVISSFKKN